MAYETLGDNAARLPNLAPNATLNLKRIRARGERFYSALVWLFILALPILFVLPAILSRDEQGAEKYLLLAIPFAWFLFFITLKHGLRG